MKAVVRGVRPVRDEAAPAVLVEQDAVAVGPDVRQRRAGVVDAPAIGPCAAGPQPEQRRDIVERQAQVDVVGVEVAQLEELDVLLEAVGHRELVSELVVTLDRLAVRRPAGDGRRHPRRVMCSKMPSASHSGSPGRSPRARSSVASSADTSLFVTMIDCRRPPSCRFSRATACAVVPEPAKKSRTTASGLSCDEEPERVLDGVQGLRETESAVRDRALEEARSRTRRRRGTSIATRSWACGRFAPGIDDRPQPSARSPMTSNSPVVDVS